MTEIINDLFDEQAILAQADSLLNAISAKLKALPTIRVNLDGSPSLQQFSKDTKQLSADQKELADNTTLLKNRYLELKNARAEVALQMQQERQAAKLKSDQDKADAAQAKRTAAEQAQAGRDRIAQIQAQRIEEEKLADAKKGNSVTNDPKGVPTNNQRAQLVSGGGPVAVSAPLTSTQSSLAIIKSYEIEIANLEAANKSLAISFKNGEISQSQYTRAIAVSTETIRANKASISTLNKEVNLGAAVNSQERNSLGRAQALILQYTNAKKGLNLATDEGVRLNDNYNKAIDNTNKFILKNADVVTKQAKNVGNYSSSFTGLANTLRGLRGPAKLFGEAIGIGAQDVDQLRLVIEHASQAIAAFFRSKEAKAAATAEDTAANVANTTTQAVNNTTTATGTEITAANTVGLEANAVASTELAAAQTTASVASRVLSTALKFTGIAVVITLVAAAAYAIYKYIKAVNDATTEQALLNEVVKDYQKGIEDATIKTDKVKVAFDEAKRSVISKKEALKIYNDTLGDTFGKTESLTEAEANYTAKAGIYIKVMGLKAQATALFALSAKEAATAVTAEQEDQTSFFDKIKSGLQAFQGNAAGAVATAGAAQEKGVQETKTKAEARRKLLLDEATKLQVLADQLSKGLLSFDKPDKTKADKQLQALKDRLNNQYEINKLGQDRLVKLYDKEVADTSKSYDERLRALDQFVKASKALIDNQANNEIEAARKATAREIQRLNEEKTGKNASQKSRINENIKTEEDNLQQQILLIRANAADKSIALALSASEKRIDINKQEIAQFEKDQKSLDDLTTAQANKRFKDFTEELKLRKEFNDKKIELEKELNSKKVQFAEAAESTIYSLFTSAFEGQGQNLENQQRLLDEATQRQINNINLLGLSEVERTRQTAVVQKQAQSDKEKLDARQRQLETKKARFDQLQQVFEIGIQTVKSVAAIKLSLAELSARAILNPKLLPLIPVLAAQIPIAIATGALEIGAVLSKPIPKYEKGTDNAKKGKAIIGEIGAELIVPKSGDPYLSPSVPSLIDLAGGEKIFSADRTKDILNAINLNHLIGLKTTGKLSGEEVNNHMQSQILKELKTISSKSRIAIHNHVDIRTTVWYEKNIRN